MNAEAYTAMCNKLAREAREKMQELKDLMLTHGDETRSMDIDEALGYLDGAMETE